MESQWYKSYLLSSWMMISAIRLKIFFSSGNKTAELYITSACSFQGTSEKHILQKSHIKHPNLIHMLFYNWHLHVRLEHATCAPQKKFYSATKLPDNLCSTMTITLWSEISTIAVALVAPLDTKAQQWLVFLICRMLVLWVGHSFPERASIEYLLGFNNAMLAEVGSWVSSYIITWIKCIMQQEVY